MSRASEIRSLVRDQVAEALLSDARGESEGLLKEAFEACEDAAEIEIANREARRLAKVIRKPVVSKKAQLRGRR